MSQSVVLAEGTHCQVPWGATLQFALKWDYVPGKTGRQQSVRGNPRITVITNER